MKDLSIEKVICHIDKNNPIGAKEGDIFTKLATDKLSIFGSLQILTLDEDKDLGIHIISIDDDIYIPAEHHPYIQVNEYNHPLFIEEKTRMWNPKLTAGKFYIMLNDAGEKKFILLKYISIDKIEYDICNPRYDAHNWSYYVEPVVCELNIEDSKDYKFISLDEMTD